MGGAKESVWRKGIFVKMDTNQGVGGGGKKKSRYLEGATRSQSTQILWVLN